MRVLYLGLTVPNLNEYHNMFTELMVAFHKDGHEVMIVGPTYDEEINGIQVEDGISVLRVPTMKLFNVGKFQKGIANLLLPYQYKRALKKNKVNLDFDLIIMPTPPITLTDVAFWLKKKKGSRVYLVLRDIFPQNAVDLKMMRKGGPAYFFFRRKEKKMYCVSDHIGCMSQKNIEFVKKHNPEVAVEKLHLLPNWGLLKSLQSVEEKLGIRKEYGLLNKFVVMFGGNIGKPQKMENIVALAKSCEDIPDIQFLILGGGNEKNTLEQMISAENIGNVTLHGFLSRDNFFKVLQSADVGLVTLSEDFTIPNIPSKAFAYYNAKIPILASVDKNTDFGSILEEIDAGVWAEAGKTAELKKKLLQLYNDTEKRQRMGQNGYDYMKANLQTSTAYLRVVKEIGIT